MSTIVLAEFYLGRYFEKKNAKKRSKQDQLHKKDSNFVSCILNEYSLRYPNQNTS